MIYKVKIDGRIFEVKIENLNSRPIIAVVDGEPVDVWPQIESGEPVNDTEGEPASKTTLSNPSPLQGRSSGPNRSNGADHSNSGAGIVHSPLPGVVISVSVQPNEEVKAGQEILVLEAMKMKNTIRAGRTGVVKKVHVVPGQAVQHHDPLVEYKD
jgi:biotin carboxyl carrier protein